MNDSGIQPQEGSNNPKDCRIQFISRLFPVIPVLVRTPSPKGGTHFYIAFSRLVSPGNPQSLRYTICTPYGMQGPGYPERVSFLSGARVLRWIGIELLLAARGAEVEFFPLILTCPLCRLLVDGHLAYRVNGHEPIPPS